ncbi:uncharacterized protein FA14DRAFT_155167 [Meira miltonrushii]|uniref:Uncharacterized protein n=1 Tax=Meira miltonrushii TaxID=1280837 RepID=A0A316VDJ9_9BASI|nr:uncharacterized protein FA14DRAFT_155167 [Meira miltonrushii]PWN35757.1 hypothetical protein FA14DRAFT_155167 [Meira miltonrushii]
MSNRCSPVPTSTLYGQFTTTQLVTNTIVATSTLPDGETTASTSYDVETSIGTQASPTSTLYSTRCRGDDGQTQAQTQAQTQDQAQTQTEAQTTTQAGGRVIVQTIIRTASSEGSVIVETQTATPTAISSPTLLASSQDTQHNTNAGAIAGGIVGAVAVLALLFGLLWFIRKRKRNAMASRNLDEFFADPSAQVWDEKQANGGNPRSRSASILGVAAGTSSRGGTLRSIKRKSLAVLDLDKEKNASETNDNHWAALTRIDSAQLDDENLGDEEVQNYGRPRSRHSLNALDRPQSFHSMSIGHGLGSQQPFGLPVPGLSPDHDHSDKEADLLRNGSDRSSKSARSPGELGALKTKSMDMLPSFLSSASPPISPTSPYNSPPLRDMPLHEGVAINANGYENVRPSIARGSQFSISSNMMMTDMTNDAKKTRSWSASSYNMPERPKSALGLSSHASPPLSSVLVGSPIQQSPPLNPTLYGQKGSANLQRGRASINGGQPHYPSKRYSGTMQTHSGRSPQYGPSSPQAYNAISPSSHYPPSQYTHLDAHKTAEERAEDRMHALNSVASMNGLDKNQDQPQRRQRSLSGALLLRVTNGEDSPPLTIPQAGEMTPTSSGERSTLSVRNADPSKSQQKNA